MKNFFLQRKIGFMIGFIMIIIVIVIYKHFHATDSANDNVSALVETIKLEQKTLSDHLTAYGSLQTNPTQTQMLTAPTNGQIKQIFVTEGEMVKKNTVLFEFVPDPSSYLTYQQAKSALTLTQSELDQANRLFQLQLTTRAQVANAKKAWLDAKAALQAATLSGSNRENQKIAAAFDGIVTQLLIHSGDRVQTGANLLQLGRCNDLVAHLGINAEDGARIEVGMPVRVNFLSNSKIMLDGKVSQVSHQINPQTHLIDVLASLSNACQTVMPGSFVQAAITISSQKLWAVPVTSVLKDTDGNYLYRIKNQKAERVTVSPLVTDQDWLGIQGTDLHQNDEIVTQGNYELQNGMSVRIAS